MFFMSSIFLKNIIIIPATITLAVSGMKLYKSIMQDRRRENIKIEIIRHTLCAIFILVMFIIASIIDVYISTRTMIYSINYL